SPKRRGGVESNPDSRPNRQRPGVEAARVQEGQVVDHELPGSAGVLPVERRKQSFRPEGPGERRHAARDRCGASSLNRVLVKLSPLPPRRFTSTTCVPSGATRVIRRSLSQVWFRLIVTSRSAIDTS